MKGKKRGWLIALAVVVGLLAVMAIAVTSGMGAVRRTIVTEVDLSRIGDGTYPGSFGSGRFQFAVQVEVKANRISSIDLVDAAKATDMTRAIAEAIIAKQTVKIDAVSGASLTTRALAKAVENALEQVK